MEDQPIEVVGQVAKGQFRLSAGEADGADEQVEPVFLMREDMLNMRTDRALVAGRGPHRAEERSCPAMGTAWHPTTPACRSTL